MPDSATLVVGGSRGLGLGIATTLADAGATVVTVARGPHAGARPGIRTEVADAADPAVPGRLIDRYRPDTVVLVAGAEPHLAPVQEQTWETFSVPWHADVRIAFHWLREALVRPLPPGSRVVVVSSGAALAGSPLSGGYAGAKATQRFLVSYARDESERAALDIAFTAVLPRLTPLTDLGRPAAAAYAARSGLTGEEYARRQGDPLTPEATGEAVHRLLATDPSSLLPAYLLTAEGLRPLP